MCRRLPLELRVLSWARILENRNCRLKGWALITCCQILFQKNVPLSVAPSIRAGRCLSAPQGWRRFPLTCVLTHFHPSTETAEADLCRIPQAPLLRDPTTPSPGSLVFWASPKTSLRKNKPSRPPAAMNFLRRRLSDSSFVANLPNGYMTDLQRPDTSTSSPASPAMERRHPQPLAASFSSPGSSLFSSFSSAMKQTSQAPSGLMEPLGPSTPVVQRPRILLVIDDAHTDW